MDFTPSITIRKRCVPPTATEQQKGVFHDAAGNIRFFTKAPVREARTVWWHILEGFVPETPLDGALFLRVALVWPHTAATPKKHRDLLIPLDKRPDMDNLVKGLQDALGRQRFWTDDARVALLVAAKFRGPVPGVSIDIGPMPRTLTSLSAEEQLDFSDGLFQTLQQQDPFR